MQYIGIQSQIARNNWNSMVLLLMFPCIILGMLWVFCSIFGFQSTYDNYGYEQFYFDSDLVNETWLDWAPWAVVIVGIWLLIAYTFNAQMIQHATGAKALERRENPRIYNMVENLCMSCGMPMPKVNIIEDSGLNAFASGINKKSYTVTLTRGIIDYLEDDELEGVIAHELTHIRNRDTRLLIVSIVFVGIFSMIAQIAFRSFLYAPRSSRRNDKNGGGAVVVMLLVMVLAAIAYFFAMLTRFAISRKREYMADAGGAELCGDPLALASALRKISRNPGLDDVGRSDVAQLFICRPDELKENLFESAFSSLFSTHPDVKKRIAILENF